METKRGKRRAKTPGPPTTEAIRQKMREDAQAIRKGSLDEAIQEVEQTLELVGEDNETEGEELKEGQQPLAKATHGQQERAQEPLAQLEVMVSALNRTLDGREFLGAQHLEDSIESIHKKLDKALKVLGGVEEKVSKLHTSTFVKTLPTTSQVMLLPQPTQQYMPLQPTPAASGPPFPYSEDGDF